MEKQIIFGTDGWRAVMADQFTMENVRTVAKAIACYTEENGWIDRGIIVGYDTRFMGRMFAQEVVRVLTAHSILSFLVSEPTPTPVVAFGVKHFGVSGAVMLTASHNSAEYNGIKYIPEYAGPASPDITQRLEVLIQQIEVSGEQVQTRSIEEAKNGKLYQPIHLKPHYEAHIRRLIRMDVLQRANLTVVVDAMHGAGSGYMSALLQEAGVTVKSIREERDPLFGGGLPEPNEHHLAELSRQVLVENADLGVANDGDADRFGVVDRQGRYLSPNEVLTLLTYHMVKNRNGQGKVIRTVATTHQLDRICEHYGLELIETPVGFKYIGAQMLRGNVLIGGEESGGASILGHIPEKDGILMNLLIAEMCAVEGKSLDEIKADIHRQFGRMYSSRLDIRFKQKEAFLLRFKEKPPHTIAGYAVEAIHTQDGFKLLLEGGHWVLIRPSGTEPLLRIYCEATGSEELERLKEAVRDWFEETN
ncbi:phosphoglucomutase/phosphomannomutase family protein [Brevibacillus laterosporus]|uniref:Phosphoglucomutase n=1 Tax=Brevibacillus laterosporus TaxID=1465 RepID=A0AAP3DG21_BRELA|nr:phosphoglucomutase/phosphomannomutase family protein [Brevibacillus laterosporus]MCR8980393.1 phosphoglucomutase/phosphomannomutase family protein [Brevibacillus laterosporus]MCZ0807548.1 phosphoglucomutase/phosphomannomutase family protein [Brevibacillus laterosporus]MCZ0825984.1 phosphoglucomutase/phosphomannomutase family protein [Brevibacillus laterosporus]MCZ0849670.1 phosphoglucomutase/phosphomannomutase family protein [Brevibacillus laterosporus]